MNASLLATEKEIENSILAYLNYRPGCFAFKVNTIGVYDQRGGFYRKLSKHVVPGTPDIICSVDVDGVGVFVGLEVKSSTGRQSKEQKAFEKSVKERGKGFYFVVRSILDVQVALDTVKSTIRKAEFLSS